MKTLKILSLAMALSAISAGCVLFAEPYKTTKHFDLGTPKRIQGAKIDVSPVTMDGPYKRKMAYRANGNELLFDEYNSWAASPERMLANYLAISLSDGESKSDAEAAVEILTFELNMETKEAVLTVKYTLKRGNGKKTSRPTMKTKLDGDSPEDFAKAMARNAEKLAADIAEKTE